MGIEYGELTKREKLLLQGNLPGHCRFKKKPDMTRLAQKYGEEWIKSDEELLRQLQEEWEEDNASA